ncbi:MAG: FAD-binding oxidoreductase [Candidatus Saccharimonas sp.]
MSKLAAYLRGHLAGEVMTRDDIRDALSTDGGVLRLKPEMVIYPRSTNDIRKVLRFTWQLAEKGHILPVTARGGGTDTTGAAIGKGISLVTTAHMHDIYEYDAKQKFVRLQPGVTVSALNGALNLQGTALHMLLDAPLMSTIGGAVADAAGGRYAGKYGTIDRAVEQLEVVLANGDVIQTGRINKREMNRRKGLQGFEGDIYRGIDSVIEEYGDILDSLAANDTTGYNTIADVKQKDGSFDLTPLFVGSQGTLGVISEMIMRSEFRSSHLAVGALVFATSDMARDALDQICSMTPAFVDYFDAELFDKAAAQGCTYPWYTPIADLFSPASVVIFGFDDFNAKHREKALKRIQKAYSKREDVGIILSDAEKAPDILSALDVATYTRFPDHKDTVAPAIFSGFHIPTARLEDFMNAVGQLAKRDHVALPLSGHAATNTYSIHPSFELHKVSDKQRLFKLLEDLTKLVYEYTGTMLAEGGEGRLKTRTIHAQLDERVVAMYAAVRKVCDPYGTLNPGVKQSIDVRELVAMLRDDVNPGSQVQLSV